MLEVDAWAFSFSIKDEDVEPILDCYAFDRARSVEVAEASRGQIGAVVAGHSSYAFDMRVPGGRTLPTAGLTWVGVHQGHRRRGILTAMIADHFERCLARNEAVSTLWAAEPAIYQRFGYGLGARDVRLKIGRKPELRAVAGSDDLMVTLETASFDLHAPIIREVQGQQQRPGTMTTLSDVVLRGQLRDLDSERQGAEFLRFATVREGDRPVAWAIFRRKGDWNDWHPNGVVKVSAWGSITAAATRRLWSVLTDFDLMGSTHAWLLATDDPLLHQLVDDRSANPETRDNLWVRVLDVKAALEGRGFEADCDVRIEVADAQVPANAGVWRILVDGGEASVVNVGAPGEAKADLVLNIQELGAAYLGGVTINALVQAGLIEERTPGAAVSLGRAMRSSLAPVCNISF